MARRNLKFRDPGKDHQPNLISYINSITSCSSCSQWPLALQLYPATTRDVAARNGIISACESWQRGLEVFGEGEADVVSC